MEGEPTRRAEADPDSALPATGCAALYNISCVYERGELLAQCRVSCLEEIAERREFFLCHRIE